MSLESWYRCTVRLKTWEQLQKTASSGGDIFDRNVWFNGVPVLKSKLRFLAGRVYHILGPNTTDDRRVPLMAVDIRDGSTYYIMPSWVDKVLLKVLKNEVTPDERIRAWTKKRNKHLNRRV